MARSTGSLRKSQHAATIGFVICGKQAYVIRVFPKLDPLLGICTQSIGGSAAAAAFVSSLGGDPLDRTQHMASALREARVINMRLSIRRILFAKYRYALTGGTE